MMDNETMLLGRIERLKQERDQILKDNNVLRPLPQISNSVIHEKRIHEKYASRISAVEKDLESLRREKEAKVQNSRAKKKRRRSKRRPLDSSSAKKVASPLCSVEQHKNDPKSEEIDALNNTPNSDQQSNSEFENDGKEINTAFSQDDEGHAASRFSDDSSCSSEEDINEEGEIEEIKGYWAERICRSKLSMVCQGFFSKAKKQQPGDTTENKTQAAPITPFDQDHVKYKGSVFSKGFCYTASIGKFSCTVGIQYFISNTAASCILVECFDNTILGIEEDGQNYKADHLVGSYVQIYRHIQELPLSSLMQESEDIPEIPCMIYQPQLRGTCLTSGYWFDQELPQLKVEQGGIRMLDVCAGGGGSWLGHHGKGFKTVLAIEINKDAVQTLKRNAKKMNAELPVYDRCVREFIENYPTMKCLLGRIDHIWFSFPCQDFSGANRFSKKGNRDRADLSLTLIDIVRLTACSTAVFENVLGIWKRHNIEYLKNIAKDLLKLGYQSKWTVLFACDYGDPQKRGRFIMYIWKKSMPPPFYPSKTHGPGTARPYETVRRAFAFKTDNSLTNLRGKKTSLKPGEHGISRLPLHGVAETIKASTSTLPFHPTEDRCINVREAACLQSFPLWYEFSGSVTSQYRQVGNAVPVKMAGAIAESVKDVYSYEFKGES